MFQPRLLAPAVLALAAASAHAGVTFNAGSDAEGAGGTADYARRDAVVNGTLLSTGGELTATAAGAQASVNAWADASSGMFKAITRIDLTGSDPYKVGQSYARLDVSDTLRFTGPGSSVVATFSLSYDTLFAGAGFAPFERAPGDGASHFLQAASDRSINLDWQVANPNYNPDAHCTFDGDAVSCPPNSDPYFSFSQGARKDLDIDVQLGNGFGTSTYTQGSARDGHYTGVVTLSAVLPTDTDIQLSYFAINSARCFNLQSCSLVIDASHSDHLGLAVQGGSFVSANGYQYTGLAPAVPEPQTVALLLAGLGVVGVAARRRRG